MLTWPQASEIGPLCVRASSALLNGSGEHNAKPAQTAGIVVDNPAQVAAEPTRPLTSHTRCWRETRIALTAGTATPAPIRPARIRFRPTASHALFYSTC